MIASHANLFLASLSPKNREFLLERSTPVTLPLKTVLYNAEEVPSHAYFMTSGIASVVSTMSSGATAEVGIIGREGIVGSLQLLGPGLVPTHCFMQLDGTGLKIPFSELKKAFRSSEDVRDRANEFIQEQVLSLSQLAGCNRFHEAEERLARWLLMVQDRTQSDVLNLTQEFLAMMLGAQRSTVTLVAGSLQRSGLIEYQRGRVKILNRENLEAAACDCYQVTKHLYAKLYKQSTPGGRK
ncbi:Crp/Fnr family transcriptional regulator [Granulicella mallensis]|uniref:Transcriptional regulator, Crp/Fnr family n=1 Tax=Granulicella mallensis (strain ATCC BAA-1857 / DSM 23137 / MP5ACTX8) TaxID=682795 RepID=G8NQJ7_GRAMM|nr:Crp/Fnr family transcriptional regulator [Granulicella mallensis]AEU37223.1 transcriptional regulator, Crp/Fnr family [Granulicella mallensis MP5ACTX8]